MVLLASIVLFFILSCGLWCADARKFNSVLTVRNGGRWGQWGVVHSCLKGHAIGFALKVEPDRREFDKTGLNGIALLCDDGGVVTSTYGPWGIWKYATYCHQSKLIAFALRVQRKIRGDNTAANNILFLCSDGTVLIGNGIQKGRFGSFSNRCTNGSICGIQTRLQYPLYKDDDTALNDVKMFCCDQGHT